MSIDGDDPTAGLAQDQEAAQAAADLKQQMDRLKARYRVERRLLEARSFEPDNDQAQQGLATRPPPVR